MRSKVVRGSRTTFRHFSRQKAALYSTRVLGFPVGEAVGFRRLKRSLHAFPLPEKNSVDFIFSAKMISLFHRLPLGGKLLAKQGDEGQPNNNRAFSLQKAALYSTRVLGFPVGEAVGFCRLKRSLQSFPLPEKNSANFISSAKIVSRFLFFPLSSTLSPFQSIPALSLSSLLYPGFRRSGSSRPLQSPFFILPALFKNHFSSQFFRSESLFSPEAQLLSHNFPQNAVLRATFFILNANICSFFYSITYKTCQHIAIFRKFFHFFYRLF